ncbi:hypothetical protein [Pelagicoccus albus]|uniref:Uncharacterized protein n=1 Tax=Pelagicoccus albus TaxID=415222 RepID=A0A7X1B4A7_9BACT|nr:hypothetical protein [Pelagicoccus albus]MBC2605386.1 hypothetical protein [Pelagicoccus albus]
MMKRLESLFSYQKTSGRSRRGFAIILVAALAGLVFLLGASLVVVSRLQTASANYDQRVRLARENALAAMDMAIAELQASMGPDRSVSYYADVYRSNTSDDFKSPSADAEGGLSQAFWTAANDVSGTERWLVTRPIDSDFNGADAGDAADPLSDDYEASVVLLGEGTLGDSAEELGVSVPKERIHMDSVEGFTDSRAIGSYAFWVGDLGTKASYALYDQTDEALLDEDYDYTTSRRHRLRWLRLTKPAIDGTTSVDLVDTDYEGVGTYSDGTSLPTNPERIDVFGSDLQFRERFGSSDEPERYLDGLTQAEFESYFQDFTPLSRGLVIDSESGGFRKDLSLLVQTSDTDYDEQLLPYAALGRALMPSSMGVVQNVYPIRGDGSTEYSDHRFVEGQEVLTRSISPIITEFNLNYSVYLSQVTPTGNEYRIYVSVAAWLELWNPFASPIGLGAGRLLVEVSGLPELSVGLENTASEIKRVQLTDPLAESDPGSFVFAIENFGNNETDLRPGQVTAYSGPEDGASGVVGSSYDLAWGPEYVGSDDRVVFDLGTVELSETPSTLVLNFADGSEFVEAALEVDLFLEDESGEQFLQAYTLEHNFSLDSFVHNDPTSEGKPVFGFGWEISDSVFDPASGYDPFATEPIESAFLTDPGSGGSTDSYAYRDANGSGESGYAGSDHILGFNPLDKASFENPALYIDSSDLDVPVSPLPKQELVSVYLLSGASSGPGSLLSLGDVGNSFNYLMDEFFFSTIPQNLSPLDDELILPNTGYVPKADAVLSDLLPDIDSVAEPLEIPASSLEIEGMFNVHSTSIDAWASLLKGYKSSELGNWSVLFGDDKYLFFNWPLGGEDCFALVEDEDEVPDTGSADAIRASFKQNVVALTEVQVDALAEAIVSRIREYMQSGAGPFRSLQEFADSGVLSTAIADLDLNEEWVVEGSPAEFRQSTIFNMIGPYLSVRSDTFLIRAYGDAVDPSDEERVWARAYCEAILQRSSEELDDSNLGRKFEVVAFRWLSPSEI